MKGTRVLIAEDEVSLASVIVDALEDIGIQAMVAADGVKALGFLRENISIPLLLSDIRMPRMDGYELVRQAIRFHPELKVVMMTGYSEEAPPSDVMRAREFRLLRKPVGIEALQLLVSDMLSRP